MKSSRTHSRQRLRASKSPLVVLTLAVPQARIRPHLAWSRISRKRNEWHVDRRQVGKVTQDYLAVEKRKQLVGACSGLLGAGVQAGPLRVGSVPRDKSARPLRPQHARNRSDANENGSAINVATIPVKMRAKNGDAIAMKNALSPDSRMLIHILRARPRKRFAESRPGTGETPRSSPVFQPLRAAMIAAVRIS